PLGSLSLPCRLPAPKEEVNFPRVTIKSIRITLDLLVKTKVQLCDIHPKSRLQPARVKLVLLPCGLHVELGKLLVVPLKVVHFVFSGHQIGEALVILVCEVYNPLSKFTCAVVVVLLNAFVT